MKTWKEATFYLLASCVVITAVIVLIPWGLLYFGELKSGWSQRTVHKSIYQQSLRPASDWVSDFHKKQGRLPRADEINQETKFKHLNCSEILIQVTPNPGQEWGVIGSDFILLVHHADWNLYLQSWDGKELKYWTD